MLITSFSDLEINTDIFTTMSDGPISANPKAFDPMAGTEGVDQVDVLLVGAGFASYTLLHRYVLRRSHCVILD